MSLCSEISYSIKTFLDVMKCCLCCKFLKVLCLPPCPRNIIEKVAFRPPPPTYNVNYDEAVSSYTFNIERSYGLLSVTRGFVPYNEIEFHYVDTKCGTRIACMYYAVTPPTSVTILYSHGNSSDLGSVIGLCVWLARNLHCNILAYDYSGYGRSSGKPSEKRMYADIEAAFNLLLEKYNRQPADIILMGQSLGSAPTLDLASRKNVRGVVIQSGFLSALNILCAHDEPKTMCCDVFENFSKAAKVTSPVLVIHGTEDDVIDFSHGVAIYEQCPRPVKPLWLAEAGHNDAEVHDQFILRLKYFISEELP